MAFNPFTSFRKYQKIWMPVILLLCMVTFVLCSGNKGDFSEWLMGLFGGREGPAIAKVGGRNLYRKELNALKEQRNAVNEFMKRAATAAVKKVNDLLDSEGVKKMPEGPERAQLLTKLTDVKSRLEIQAVKPRFFGAGVTLDDLVDFKVWLHEADRLGVALVPEDVKRLLNQEVYAYEFKDFGIKLFDANERESIYPILQEMRSQRQAVSESTIFKGLYDEFRARIAQKMLALSDPRFEVSAPELSRIPLSPAMLWDYFKENRLTFDVALLPIDIAKFTAQVPQPTDAELQSLYKAHYKDNYSPASATPGFEILASTRVEMVVGDPAAPNYKAASKAVLEMLAIPPVWIPSSPWSVLERYASGPLAMRETLEKQYDAVLHPSNAFMNTAEAMTGESRAFREQFSAGSWYDPDAYFAIAGFFARKQPEAAAGMIAANAQPGNIVSALGYYAAAQAKYPDEIRKGIAAELKQVAPLYAPVILAGTTGSALDTMATFGVMHAWGRDDKGFQQDKFLPLDVVRGTLTELIERKLAQEWVNANMNKLRVQLEGVVGNKAKFNRELDKYLPGMGLELVPPRDDVYYNRYSIADAPELKPLLKEYEKWYRTIDITEGRDMKPETVLKDDDFWKLFFDGTEPFSAYGSTYKARPWPPVVTPKKVLGEVDPTKQPIKKDYFTLAPKPILFWKVEDRPGKIPESIDQVKDRVVAAWKAEKARALALPVAKKFADELQSSNVGFGPVLAFKAPDDAKPIVLKGLAPLYTATDNFMPWSNRSYARYQVPRNTVEYPRDDMSQELLSLTDLKKPIEIGDKKLDDLNKELYSTFEKIKKADDSERIVQILTNKPQTAFYVACVTFKSNERSKQVVEEFNSVLRNALPTRLFQGASARDEFVDIAYTEASKAHLRALMEQLYSQTDSQILLPDERKGFDTSEGG
jgi:hypothetical protein